MIFWGRYERINGIYRPYILAFVQSNKGEWVQYPFLIDTGADETFLPYETVQDLDLDLTGIEVKDDVGGIGAQNVPYFKFKSGLKIIYGDSVRIFKGEINVFLDPHASDVPLLGRDVLDNFVVIFDRIKERILLLDEEEEYLIKSLPG